MTLQNIGILGGTFDPIHQAHIVIAEEAMKQYQLNSVLFIPNGQPAHKSPSVVSSAEDRFAMVNLAILNHPGFRISRIEIDRIGTSYAVDTLRQLVTENEHTQFWFITGVDTIVDVPSWHQFPELITLCKFLVAERPGIELDIALALLPPELSAVTEVVDVDPMRISSTDIRNRIKNNESLTEIVPEPVEHYIINNGLYLSR